MKTILQYIAYWGACIQLHCLETNLQGMCDTLPDLNCHETRSNAALAVQRLSLEVVNARNRAAALRPMRRIACRRSMA